MPAKPKRFTLSTVHAKKHADGSVTWGPLAAAAVTLALLKVTGTASMAELVSRLEAGDETVTPKFNSIVLTEEQIIALEDHREAVDLIRTGPTVTVTVCPSCGGISAVSGATPKSCNLTLSCPGEPEKASAAVKYPYNDAA